jgi:hypothetical protein
VNRLTLADIERARSTPGATVLLFLTDRCPVGCAHCSVDSRVDSPTITDFEQLQAVLTAIKTTPSISVAGISGGEPFIERRGLMMAVDQLTAAGKHVVPHTSGVWARGEAPQWVRAVLRKSSCIVLSTDGFHADAIDDDTFVRAARTIADEGAWIVVQVLAVESMIDAARRLLADAFGPHAPEFAELNLIPPLPYGRAQGVFLGGRKRRGETFGACQLLNSAVVRYDGTLSPCCNEQVIMGAGPPRLRRHAQTADGVRGALHDFETDPLLGAIATAGIGALTAHPRFRDLADREFTSICEICWEMQRRLDGDGLRHDGVLVALSAMTHAPVTPAMVT